MKIKDNKWLLTRDKPEKHTKYQVENNVANHLTNANKKKLYDYYICDHCGEEIKIEKKWENKTGGIVTLPMSLTGLDTYKLALCNKCVKPVIKEFEEGGK